MKKISRKIGNELEDFVGAISDPSKADKTEVAAIENVYGSKNLLPNNAVTRTINGITFTVNEDKTSPDYKSITVNGTATAQADFTWDTSVSAGYYLVNGIPNAADTSKTYFLCQKDGLWASIQRNEKNMTVNTEVIKFGIRVLSGTTVNNLTFYPMIRDARISDPSYVSYAMTNRELTDRVGNGLQDYTLLGSWVGDASWAAKQLSDNLSKYKEIMFCIAGVNASDVIINPVRISYKKFKTLNASNKYLGFSAMLSVSALCKYSVYYSSDTMIYLYSDNELSAQYKFALYGIK